MAFHHGQVCIAALFSASMLAGPLMAAEYLAIPGGSFTSVLSNGASNTPVTVSAFQMRVTPVSNAEFSSFIATYPEWQRARIARTFADDSYLSNLPSDAADGGALPVTSVSWFAAQAFCETEGGRLPTWYEWEYVAAADSTHADARRDPAWRARILKWYSKSASGLPDAIGGAPNFYGLRNMHGLIWEWVDDFNALLVSSDSRTQNDPEQLKFCGAGAISLQDKENYAVLMRVALLSSLGAADTTTSLGFRCVRTKDPL